MRNLTYEETFETGTVYIPKIIRIEKTKVEGCTYITSLAVDGGYGHILSKGNTYFLCLSADDSICFYPRLNEPIGYKRPTLGEVEALAAMFNCCSQEAAGAAQELKKNQ